MSNEKLWLRQFATTNSHLVDKIPSLSDEQKSKAKQYLESSPHRAHLIEWARLEQVQWEDFERIFEAADLSSGKKIVAAIGKGQVPHIKAHLFFGKKELGKECTTFVWGRFVRELDLFVLPTIKTRAGDKYNAYTMLFLRKLQRSYHLPALLIHTPIDALYDPLDMYFEVVKKREAKENEEAIAMIKRFEEERLDSPFNVEFEKWAIDFFAQKVKAKAEDVEKVYENDNGWQIFRPKTFAAASQLAWMNGRKAKWCTAASATTFAAYYKNGTNPLYIIRNETEDKMYQMDFGESTYYGNFMDEADAPLSGIGVLSIPFDVLEALQNKKGVTVSLMMGLGDEYVRHNDVGEWSVTNFATTGAMVADMIKSNGGVLPMLPSEQPAWYAAREYTVFSAGRHVSDGDRNYIVFSLIASNLQTQAAFKKGDEAYYMIDKGYDSPEQKWQSEEKLGPFFHMSTLQKDLSREEAIGALEKDPSLREAYFATKHDNPFNTANLHLLEAADLSTVDAVVRAIQRGQVPHVKASVFFEHPPRNKEPDDVDPFKAFKLAMRLVLSEIKRRTTATLYNRYVMMFLRKIGNMNNVTFFVEWQSAFNTLFDAMDAYFANINKVEVKTDPEVRARFEQFAAAPTGALGTDAQEFEKWALEKFERKAVAKRDDFKYIYASKEDDWVIISPLTYAANNELARMNGRKAKWCTAAEPNLYKTYTEGDNPLYVVRSQQADLMFQMDFGEGDGEASFMDETDGVVSVYNAVHQIPYHVLEALQDKRGVSVIDMIGATDMHIEELGVIDGWTVTSFTSILFAQLLSNIPDISPWFGDSGDFSTGRPIAYYLTSSETSAPDLTENKIFLKMEKGSSLYYMSTWVLSERKPQYIECFNYQFDLEEDTDYYQELVAVTMKAFPRARAHNERVKIKLRELYGAGL